MFNFVCKRVFIPAVVLILTINMFSGCAKQPKKADHDARTIVVGMVFNNLDKYDKRYVNRFRKRDQKTKFLGGIMKMNAETYQTPTGNPVYNREFIVAWLSFLKYMEYDPDSKTPNIPHWVFAIGAKVKGRLERNESINADNISLPHSTAFGSWGLTQDAFTHVLSRYDDIALVFGNDTMQRDADLYVVNEISVIEKVPLEVTLTALFYHRLASGMRKSRQSSWSLGFPEVSLEYFMKAYSLHNNPAKDILPKSTEKRIANWMKSYKSKDPIYSMITTVKSTNGHISGGKLISASNLVGGLQNRAETGKRITAAQVAGLTNLSNDSDDDDVDSLFDEVVVGDLSNGVTGNGAALAGFDNIIKTYVAKAIVEDSVKTSSTTPFSAFDIKKDAIAPDKADAQTLSKRRALHLIVDPNADADTITNDGSNGVVNNNNNKNNANTGSNVDKKNVAGNSLRTLFRAN